MKAKIILTSMLAISLAACSSKKDIEVPQDGEVAINVVANIDNAATRAAGTEWAANDVIGISTTSNTRTTYVNVPYKYDGTKFEAENAKIYFQSSDEVTFSAYYPYAVNAGTLTATTNAAAQENQPAIDFLFAKDAKADKSNPTVNFTGDAAFHHRMSQITITFEDGNDVEFTDKLTAYSINGLVLDGTFNTESGVAQAVGTAANLEMALENVTVTDKKYTAASLILFPQDVAEGKIAFTVTVDGNTYNATLILPDADNDGAKDTALKAGYNYKFPVRVSKTALIVGEAEIVAWNDVDGDSAEAIM